MLSRIADGRTDLVFEWIASGGAATATDTGGTVLIQWCAYFGDVSAIRFLLVHGETLKRLGPKHDLNGAAFHGHWRLCQFLIEHGADPNYSTGDTDETPLHAATSVANRPAHDLVVRVLLAAGANPAAVTQPDRPTGCFMRDARTKSETALHRAAAFGSLAMTHSLTAAGAPLDARDMAGDTPLSWASWHQRPSAILRALCHGDHHIHPAADWDGDHGAGWRGMDGHLLGDPQGAA